VLALSTASWSIGSVDRATFGHTVTARWFEKRHQRPVILTDDQRHAANEIWAASDSHMLLG
jgi:hypothetical protein